MVLSSSKVNTMSFSQRAKVEPTTPLSNPKLAHTKRFDTPNVRQWMRSPNHFWSQKSSNHQHVGIFSGTCFYNLQLKSVSFKEKFSDIFRIACSARSSLVAHHQLIISNPIPEAAVNPFPYFSALVHKTQESRCRFCPSPMIDLP